MQFKAAVSPYSPLTKQPPNFSPNFPNYSLSSLQNPKQTHFNLRISKHGLIPPRNPCRLCCVSPGQELLGQANGPEFEVVEDDGPYFVEPTDGLGNQNMWEQIVEIVKFSGPATGIWICGPLMSLIDTAVIGQGSSLELAALGPGTVLCDYVGYVFMFLSIATSNMVATSLARQDESQVQHQISMLLFFGLASGVVMLLLTKFFGEWALTGFVGGKNLHLVPSANLYTQHSVSLDKFFGISGGFPLYPWTLGALFGHSVDCYFIHKFLIAIVTIRALSWPAVLIGSIAQSASLGMKDSLGPLKALVIASALNGFGDVVLCSFLGYGIAGAAWATAASQVVAAYYMVDALNRKGYNGFSFVIPSITELQEIFEIAAPVFITMASKVTFYGLAIYFATSMGTHVVAAHQVLVQIFGMCSVWGEPLSQTAQSFMPELLYGANRSLVKARSLLKSLLIIGACIGLVLGAVATSIPFLFPGFFTSDLTVIGEMQSVAVAFFLALCVTPCILPCEGTLLAGRDLKFISTSMSVCFTLGALVLLLLRSQGLGLVGCWGPLVGFQWARFLISLGRLVSPNGVLQSENVDRFRLAELKAA